MLIMGSFALAFLTELGLDSLPVMIVMTALILIGLVVFAIGFQSLRYNKLDSDALGNDNLD